MTVASRLRTIADECAAEVISEFDRYDAHEVDQRIGDRLKDMPDIYEEVVAAAATSARKRVEKALQPKIAQGSLFEPDAILILGDSQRVRMAAATVADKDMRVSVITENNRAQMESFFAEMGYWNSRTAIWRDSPELSLSEIESRFFDWIPDDAEPDDDEEA